MMAQQMDAVFAGFGGQGVLFAGKVAAMAGLIAGREVSWLPSYGPELRGGTANCSVTLSDDPIGSPLVLTPNVLVAMNQPSFVRFVPEVVDGGLVIFDETLVSPEGALPERTFGLPATKMAEDAGLAGLANMVLVGALWEKSGFCAEAELLLAVDKCVSASRQALVQKNKQAIMLGAGAARGH